MKLTTFQSKLTSLRLVCEEIRECVSELADETLAEFFDNELCYIEHRIMDLEDYDPTKVQESFDLDLEL